MLLTGYAGQVSLGHAGLLAAGAFTVGILVKELSAPFWVTLPAAAAVGAVLGVAFGLPSLRLRGLYLAVSTLALYFVVHFVGSEYETRRGFSTGIVIDPPALGSFVVSDARIWYFVLLAAAAATVVLVLNLLRARSGRAWRALRDHETLAAALGIHVPAYKLAAFVVSSMLTAIAGALFAYYRGFVSVEAFSLFLSIQYVAMVIIKSDFVSTVSHDLRSPLTAIFGYVELLGRVGKLNPQQEEFVRRIQVSVENITSLINDLLDLGRIEAGFDARKEIVPLSAIIRYTAESMLGLAQKKAQSLDVFIPEGLPHILGNPVRLRQLLENLIGNALLYTPENGEIKIIARIEGNQITS